MAAEHVEEKMHTETLSIYAVGDVAPDRASPEALFELALPTLQQADILFGQLEVPLADKGQPQLQGFPFRRVSPDRVSGLTYAGFDILSLAGNHHMDLSEEGLFATMEILAKNNIAAIGVGKNIDEARKPLIVERKGITVAFLAYSSVVPAGYEARPDKSGCAPMRASTSYQQIDWQPGTPPRVITVADRDDLLAILEDIKKTRPLVDVLVMSIHWGVHNVPGIIAMYQKEVAHAAIDAGVDLILGHHDHIIKGIEVYKGKVIFYSLANFVMPSKSSGYRSPIKTRYGIKLDPEYADYDFLVDSRKSLIAKCIISNGCIERIAYVPVMINKNAQPEVLPRSDKRSSEIFDYMEWCCQHEGIDTKFSWDGNDIVVHT